MEKNCNNKIKKIFKLRKKIDKIDRIIIKNLIKRFFISKEIIKNKIELNKPIEDLEREKEIFINIEKEINKLLEKNFDGKNSNISYINRLKIEYIEIYKKIIDISKHI